MMSDMRTTLTLDDDLAGLLKQRAEALGVSFKEAVNRAIRAGLGEAALAQHRPAPKTMPAFLRVQAWALMSTSSDNSLASSDYRRLPIRTLLDSGAPMAAEQSQQLQRRSPAAADRAS